MGDPVLLSRAMVNVLDNACRAVAPGGAVRLSVSSEADMASLDVDDAGDSADAGRTGYGRGLPIVQAVLWRHSGTVAQFPSDLGGMRVHWTLPLAPADLSHEVAQ
jgi:signal transduction histidine kinase